MSAPPRMFQKIIFLLGLHGLLFTASICWASSLLTQPADMSPRAVKSVQLSLAGAGKRQVSVGERGFVLTSDDQGRSWQQSPVPVSVTLTSVFFITPQKGWAVGHAGVVLSSEDGGRSWSKLMDGNQAAALELAAAQAANDPPSHKGDRRVREAERLVKSGADKPFLALHFFDERHGLVVGAYGLIYSTENGGESWRSLAANVPNVMGLHLYDICEVGSDTYLVGEQGVVFRASAGSEQFERIETPYEGSFFGMLSSVEGDLVLFGLRGNVLRSTDRGVHWDAVEMAQPVTLSAGTRLANGDLILVDETGGVLRSSDRGANFVPVKVDHPTAFTAVLQATDGALITSGVRGATRIELQPTTAGMNQ